jgi:hypothetical protein
MLVHILISCAVIAGTIIVHASVMLAVLQNLHSTHAGRWARRSYMTKVTAISILVLAMFVASVIEAAIWAAVYLVTGAIEDPEEAMYFSMVTYSTLGYGDIVLGEKWRLLATFEAANGIIMFGWSTALIFAGVHTLYLSVDSARSTRPLQGNERN